jgi:hypothetical protein
LPRICYPRPSIETLILGARAEVREVQRLIDQRVDFDRPPLTGRAARVFQHAADDAVGASPVLGDLFQIARERLHGFVDLRAPRVVQRRQRRRGLAKQTFRCILRERLNNC